MADDIVLSLKDALRGLRYAARAEAGLVDDALGGRAAPGPLLGLADAVFGPLEGLVLPALSRRRRGGEDGLPPIGAWIAAPETEAVAAFTRASYRAFKLLLRHLRVRNALVSEQAIESAGRQLRARHHDLLERVATKGEAAEAVALCAATAAALVAARPLRRLDPGEAGLPRHMALSPNITACLAIGLAAATVSVHADEAIAPEAAIEAACLAAEARFQRLASALRAADPAAALAQEFAVIVPHLP